jgi:hypothetical protein
MASADLKPVDALSAARILTRKTVLIGNVLTLTPALLMFAGLGLAGGAAYWAFPVDTPVDDSQLPNPIMGGVLVVLGLLIAAAAAYWGLRNTTRLGNWYLRRLTRREIKSRPDGLVDPDDPEAVFVEVVPRENWTRLMLETASDVGFLLVDEGRREVRFEGDRERMRIPAAAILSCDVEETEIGEGTPGAMKYYFTVILAEHPAGVRELPFAYRGDLGQLGAQVREGRAVALRDRVWGLIS